jgi:REP element-mobilizing transposase RayT
MTKLITRKNSRLKSYNYSDNGWYFVTICSKDRKNIFGEYNNKIVGEGLAPSRYKNHKIPHKGQPQGLSLQAPVRYQNDIKLSKIGQIIDIQWNDIPNQYDNIELDEYIIMSNHIHGILVIDKRDGASPSPTISNIIGSFKSKCSVDNLNYIKHNNLNTSGQIWQRSFYDHVIRNERSLMAVRKYISENPENWEQDMDNLINL